MPFARFEYEYSCSMNDAASTVDSPGEATPRPVETGEPHEDSDGLEPSAGS
jgi:hypothetical protein